MIAVFQDEGCSGVCVFQIHLFTRCVTPLEAENLSLCVLRSPPEGLFHSKASLKPGTGAETIASGFPDYVQAPKPPKDPALANGKAS